MRIRPLAVTAAAALALSACTYGPRVNVDYDATANFHQYRTYSWVDTPVPQGMNPLMFARVRASIDRSLAARGYTQAATSPDFSIAFTIGARDRLKVYDYGPDYPGWGWGRWGWGGWGWGGWGWSGWPGYSNVDVDQYTERSVIIDIYDGPTKRPIWHGEAANNEYYDRVDYAKLDRAVDAALANFPPQPGPVRG
ncbi:MAG TPA: DUF4136 domain-containing protein [Sphingomicrobium sp.]